MSERLAVVLVHRQSHLDSPSESQKSTTTLDQITEELVGNLAGRPGLDLVLIGPLAELSPGDTDTLTLESIPSDVAVITRNPAEKTIKELTKLGFDGARARHQGDLDAAIPSPSQRRIYAFNLNDPWTTQPLIDSLDKLRSVKAVKTLSLGPSPASPNSTSPNSASPSSASPASASSVVQGNHAAPQERHFVPPTNVPPTPAMATNAPPPDHTTEPDDSLDALIDELDQFDV